MRKKTMLITGMSGTGKSTVIGTLAERGYPTVDLDAPEWSEYRDVSGNGDIEWVWREDRVEELLADPGARPRFVSGCASNQGKFYRYFDHVVLLTAPLPVIVERLATRTTNNFGKDPEELARILGDIEQVEPLLRRNATAEIDTSLPPGDVLETVLKLAGDADA